MRGMRHPQMAPRVPVDIARKAKSNAALNGQTLGEYITELIENNLNYRCHYEEMESVRCPICEHDETVAANKEKENV